MLLPKLGFIYQRLRFLHGCLLRAALDLGSFFPPSRSEEEAMQHGKKRLLGVGHWIARFNRFKGISNYYARSGEWWCANHSSRRLATQ